MKGVLATINVGTLDYVDLTLPGLKQYAESHGYEYVEYTNPTDNPDAVKLQIVRDFVTTNKDRLIIVDADVYVLLGSPLPPFGGVHINPEPEHHPPFVKWLNGETLPEGYVYGNAGVITFDKRGAKRFVGIADEIPYRHSPYLAQNYINLVLSKMSGDVHPLPKSFNAIWNGDSYKERGYFLHAAGARSKRQALLQVREDNTVVHDYPIIGGMSHRDNRWDSGLYDEVIKADCYVMHHFVPKGIDNPVTELRRVIDVGANVGFFSRYVKRIWPKCQIDALEPYPPNLYYLRNNLAAFEGVNIHPAIGWHTTQNEVPFYSWRAIASGKNTGSGTAVLAKGAPDFTVPAIKVSDLFGAEDEIDIIKMDCEGGEVAVLQDLFENNRMRNVRWFRMEFHGRDMVPLIQKYTQGTHDMSFQSASQGIAIGHRIVDFK